MCGHESPPGSSFCLNCGSALAVGQTPARPQGLPASSTCPVCRGENPPGMKFCRNCGSALGGSQVAPGMMAPAGPIASPPVAPPPMAGMPAPGQFPTPPSQFPPPPMPPTGPMIPSVPRPPIEVPPTLPPQAKSPVAPPPAERTVTCPRCGTPTPMGFAYCQQCGLHMSALQPTDPGAGLGANRPRSPSSQPVGAPGNTLPQRPPSGAQPQLKMPIDPQAATMATNGRPPHLAPQGVPAPITTPGSGSAPVAAMRPSAGPAWGTAVLVNRDGSDGQRYPLAGEYLVVGRAGSDIAFDDDRFLARQHARFERAGDGSVRVVPMDTLNGVFRKADAPVDLADGIVVLVGREVLRFEKVDAEEAKVHPLVRHGVALFGSPPREPWGRLVQLIPSGGHRDVRHLVGEETVLGREEGDIVFRDDAFMSRRHAAVTWDGKRAQITDLGSSNGTFVRVTSPTPVKHGDHIRMGDQLLRIELGR